jgi:hypothetical protein
MKMFGGLKKTTSRLAITIAAGFLMGGVAVSSANAADLGGDCCADLEERVSELEATTVRKGNRKVSLKLSGHVNRMIVYWDDGINDDVYFLDNSESETRFRLTGDGEIAPGWTAGFKIEVEVVDAEGSTVDQLRDDATPDGSNDGDDNSDGAVNARKMSWFIKNTQLGKITVGRDSPATDDINQLNIASNPIADADFDNMRDFHLVAPQGTSGCNGASCRTSVNLDTIMANIDTRRANGIRYDSPSLFGLVISAFYGEDDLVDIAVRYKKEMNSIRLIAGIGYLWNTDEDPDRTIVCPQPGLGNAQNAANCVDERTDVERLVGSASAMHIPTGIYIYGAASHDQFGAFNNSSNGAAPQFFSPVNGRVSAPDATTWYLQAGVKRRLLAPNLGKTTIYAEYGQWNDFGVGLNAAAFGGPSGLFTRANSEITDSSADLWGFGLVQNIDPAAMQLYLGARMHQTDVRIATTGPAPLPNNPPAGSKFSTEDLFTVSAGAKIKF